MFVCVWWDVKPYSINQYRHLIAQTVQRDLSPSINCANVNFMGITLRLDDDARNFKFNRLKTHVHTWLNIIHFQY